MYVYIYIYKGIDIFKEKKDDLGGLVKSSFRRQTRYSSVYRSSKPLEKLHNNTDCFSFDEQKERKRLGLAFSFGGWWLRGARRVDEGWQGG